jgi:SNF2 family DNA or RNA helicase
MINALSSGNYSEMLESSITRDLLYLRTRMIAAEVTLTKPLTFDINLQIFNQTIEVINFTEEIIITSSILSGIFHRLKIPLTDGKNYQDSDSMQIGLFRERDTQKPVIDKVRKAYTVTKTRRSVTIRKKSIWDLLLPLLQPPISTVFSGEFDLYNELYPFQKNGIEFLLNSPSALLADQMGTGKTVQTIIALRLLFRQNKIKSALIICPLSVLGSAHLSTITGKSEGWDGHFFNWAPELIVTMIRGDLETREYDWKSPAHIYLTTYDTLRNDTINGLVTTDILNSLDCVVLDEAQYIKNKSSGRSKAVRKTSPKLRWALTGTPIENKIDDVISIFSFVKPGLFKDKEYTNEEVRATIEPYFLRRLKKDVLQELPDKIREDKWLELDGDQRDAYDKFFALGRKTLEESVEKDKEFVVKGHIFSILQRLKQICNFAPNKNTSPKTDLLLESIESIIENNDKLLIFSQYRDYGINRIESLLNQKKIEYVTLKGGMSDFSRNEAMRIFKQDSSTHVLIASVRSAGLGITLTEASYVIHFDHWWNPAIIWQAEDRAHRPGQKKNLNIMSFWIQDTIEENIKEKLAQKGLLIENVIDSLAVHEIEQMISTKEWLEMFGVKTDTDKFSSERAISLDDSIKKIKQLSPLEFEEITKNYFIHLGFPNARITKKSHDGGIDVFGSRAVGGREDTFIAQCKRTDVVGVKTARELLGVLAAIPNVDRGYLITSGNFSSDCMNFANSNPKLFLMNGLLFAKRLQEFNLV